LEEEIINETSNVYVKHTKHFQILLKTEIRMRSGLVVLPVHIYKIYELTIDFIRYIRTFM